VKGRRKRKGYCVKDSERRIGSLENRDESRSGGRSFCRRSQSEYVRLFCQIAITLICRVKIRDAYVIGSCRLRN
jgi:hypothetical protein